MTETPQVTALADDAEISHSVHWEIFLERASQLNLARYVTPRTKVEAAAFLRLYQTGTITAGEIWRWLLPFYDIAPSVSSTPDPDNESDWLAPVHADQDAIWTSLITLASGQAAKPVPELADLYEDNTDEDQDLAQQWVRSLAQQTELLSSRYNISGTSILSAMPHGIKHDVSHGLAVQWLGGTFAIGYTLHSLPVSGGSGFGSEGQAVYALKALALALANDLSTLKKLQKESPEVPDSNTPAYVAVAETRGRVRLWWDLLKGFVLSMVQTHQGYNIPATLVQHPDVVQLIKDVLLQGLEAGNESGPATPLWSGRLDCAINEEVSNTHTDDLIAQFTGRMDEEVQDREQQEGFWAHG